MPTALFSVKPYDRQFFEAALADDKPERLHFHGERLTAETAVLATGCDVVCAFVNDALDAAVISGLESLGVRLIALRCAGYNQVDLAAAGRAGIAVARVPAYSPHAVAEHTLALILTLNRKTHRAYNRVREGNFALDGLLGFDLYRKTVGIIGTGQIGSVVAQILTGMGCRVLAHDPVVNPACEALGVSYVDLPQLLGDSDIVTLHCPLTPDTHHLINADTLARLKPGAMLINTSRGAVLDTRAVIRALKARTLGSLGLDVYEEEGELFFEDWSASIIPDDVLARLLTFPNVLITGHQGFFTAEAMQAIATTTLANIASFRRSGKPLHAVWSGMA